MTERAHCQGNWPGISLETEGGSFSVAAFLQSGIRSTRGQAWVTSLEAHLPRRPFTRYTDVRARGVHFIFVWQWVNLWNSQGRKEPGDQPRLSTHNREHVPAQEACESPCLAFCWSRLRIYWSHSLLVSGFPPGSRPTENSSCRRQGSMKQRRAQQDHCEGHLAPQPQSLEFLKLVLFWAVLTLPPLGTDSNLVRKRKGEELIA